MLFVCFDRTLGYEDKIVLFATLSLFLTSEHRQHKNVLVRLFYPHGGDGIMRQTV